MMKKKLPPKSNQGFKHKHSLGQNFILDEGLLETLVSLSDVGKQDRVLEIGPGTGGMTKELAKRCQKVIALEIDERLIPILHVALEKEDNVSIVQGDVMRVSLPELTAPLGAFHIVANIPYYLTTPLVEMLMASGLPILSMNLMVQKEAAERMTAQKGQDGYGPLALEIRQYFDASIVLSVPAACFTPPPKVDSAFIKMKKREAPYVKVMDAALLHKIIHAAFAMRRKTLLNNLMNAFSLSRSETAQWLERAALPLTVRGEELELQQFAQLANCR